MPLINVSERPLPANHNGTRKSTRCCIAGLKHTSSRNAYFHHARDPRLLREFRQLNPDLQQNKQPSITASPSPTPDPRSTTTPNPYRKYAESTQISNKTNNRLLRPPRLQRRPHLLRRRQRLIQKLHHRQHHPKSLLHLRPARPEPSKTHRPRAPVPSGLVQRTFSSPRRAILPPFPGSSAEFRR
jgi:hypothetical protein